MSTKTPTKTPVARRVLPKKQETVRYATYVNSNLDGGGVVDQNSIRIQREAVRDYVIRDGRESWIGPVAEYEDIGRRGGIATRPALKRMMSDVAEGKLDWVVFFNLESVVSCHSDAEKIMRHFQQYRTGISQPCLAPARIQRITAAFALFLADSQYDQVRRSHQGKKAKRIRCAVYMRGHRGAGDVRNTYKQDKMLRRFLTFWWMDGAACRVTRYEDRDDSEQIAHGLALKRLLTEVNAGRVDCVVVHHIDRLLEGGIGYEELLAKFRQHDVALLALHPLMFHAWGKRMEDAWIGCLSHAWHEVYDPHQAKPRAK